MSNCGCGQCAELCNCINIGSSDNSILVVKTGCCFDLKFNPNTITFPLTVLNYFSTSRILTYKDETGTTNSFSLANDLQTISLSGNVLTLSKLGGSVTLPGVADNIYLEKTYSQISTLIATSGLFPNVMYKITDRGDNGLFFNAISTTQLSKIGTRLMLVPTFYGIGANSGNTWIGVWSSTKTVTVGQLTIWGGLVWRNLTGTIGSIVDNIHLDTTNWIVIPKAGFTHSEYIQLEFNILYDIINDWVEKQWDDKGNMLGYGTHSTTAVPNTPSGTNPIDISDWNFATSTYAFNENIGYGIFNNNSLGPISNNIFKVGYIYNNDTISGIYNNIIFNGIFSNKPTTLSSIYGNIGLVISTNTNGGSIYNNTTNAGITGNTNTGKISLNICNGIVTNSNTGIIEGNLVPGEVDGTFVAGMILNNSNTGNIDYNIILSGLIEGNYNLGAISANETQGINFNGIHGFINGNKNNGFISHCISTVAVNILNNINNGNIGQPSTDFTYSANVTDTIVNK